MSFFTPQTTVVDIDDDNCITLRKLTFGEMVELWELVPDMNEQKIGMEMVQASIESWSGPGFEDKPVTRENIRLLPVAVIMPLMEAAAGMNTVDDAEEKA